MSDEIKEGDLVRVEYPLLCCGNRSGIGYTFYVSRITEISRTDAVCKYCETPFIKMVIAIEVGTNIGDDIRCLKRIDPPAVNDKVETQREVTA